MCRRFANRAGRFDNKATVAGEFGLTAESQSVTTVVRQPVLTITKSCKAREYINRPISAEITVANTGDGVARDTVIEDTLPAGAELRIVGRGKGGPVPALTLFGPDDAEVARQFD